jgi:hypothetical protein
MIHTKEKKTKVSITEDEYTTLIVDMHRSTFLVKKSSEKFHLTRISYLGHYLYFSFVYC